MHKLQPAQLHFLETLPATVAMRANKQPSRIPRGDGHGQGSWGQAALMEPLTATSAGDHTVVPAPWATTVTVDTLSEKV